MILIFKYGYIKVEKLPTQGWWLPYDMNGRLINIINDKKYGYKEKFNMLQTNLNERLIKWLYVFKGLTPKTTLKHVKTNFAKIGIIVSPFNFFQKENIKKDACYELITMLGQSYQWTRWFDQKKIKILECFQSIDVLLKYFYN